MLDSYKRLFEEFTRSKEYILLERSSLVGGQDLKIATLPVSRPVDLLLAAALLRVLAWRHLGCPQQGYGNDQN